jgi:hypothetical protein
VVAGQRVGDADPPKASIRPISKTRRRCSTNWREPVRQHDQEFDANDGFWVPRPAAGGGTKVSKGSNLVVRGRSREWLEAAQPCPVFRHFVRQRKPLRCSNHFDSARGRSDAVRPRDFPER